MKPTPGFIFILTSLLAGILGQEYNFTVKKCACGWSRMQEENDTLCAHHSTSYVEVWDEGSHIGNEVYLGNISNVVAAPLNCPPTHQKVVVRGIAKMSPDGQLLPYPEPSTDDYCVENYQNSDGLPGHQYEYCVQYEPFRLCCPPTETFNELGKCGQPRHQFPISYDYVVQDVQCSGNESPAHEPVFVEDSLITLKDVFGYYTGNRNNNSCLMAHQFNGEILYFRRYCECDGVTCIEQCCSPTESYNVNSSTCEPSTDSYAPQNLIFPEVNINPIARSLQCEESFVLDFSTNKHSILKDGSLVPKVGQPLPLHSFCLGLVQTADNVTISSGLGCFPTLEEPMCAWRFTVIQVFLVISSVFIALTIGVYLMIKDLRNRTAGACLICELIAMLISQVNLVVIQKSQGNFSSGGCLVAGVIEIIFVLATFSWLNVICYDMWTTFRSLRSYSPKSFNTKVFLKFSLYAWGVPTVIGLSVVAVELLDLHPRPNFSPHDSCFFSSRAGDRIAQWIYLYSFIALSLLANLVFFLSVIYKIYILQKEQKKFQARGSKRNDQQNTQMESTKLYGSLFIIMGLPWLIEIFSSFAADSHECYIWVLDIVNLLRGVVIFFIFVLKKSSRLKIMRHLFATRPSNDSSDNSRKTSMMVLSNWLSSRRTTSAVVVKP